jgi:hypothetical protein
MSQLWDRQPDESAAAHVAFACYRDLGPRRSLALAYDVWLAQHAPQRQRNAARPPRPPGHWTRWSSQHHWPARAAAFDAWIEARLAARREELERATAASWAARREAQREREWELAEALVDRARLMLAWPLAEERVTARHPDGQPHTTVILPARWNMHTVARYLALACDLARLAAEMRLGRAGAPQAEPEREAIPLDLLQRIVVEAEALDAQFQAGGGA